MSSVFTGYPIETKPGKPRLDIQPGTDGDVPKEFNFQYKLYNDIAFMGDFNVGFAVGDNVDLSKPQTIHSAFGYLRDYLLENSRQLVRDPIFRNGIVASLGQHQVKSQTEVVVVPGPANAIEEIDLDQDKINLCIYVQSEGGAIFDFAPGPFYTAMKRLTELARENNYFTVGEPRRGIDVVPDDSVAAGGTANFAPPSFNDGPDGVGGAVINSYWIENGILMRPLRDGDIPLVLINVTAEMDGNVYQVRASSGAAYRHSATGLLTVT